MYNYKIGIDSERRDDDYFEYENQKYYVGTIVKMNNPKDPSYNDVIAIFKGINSNNNKYIIGYNTEFDMASNKIYKNFQVWRTIIYMDKNNFTDRITEIIYGNNHVIYERKKKYDTDTSDLNLTSKWGIYILLMVITSVFNGRIFGWIMWTIIFFAWRHNYREENCVYYE